MCDGTSLIPRLLTIPSEDTNHSQIMIMCPYVPLTLRFFRYLSKGQVNLYFTCPRAQVTCPNTKFLYKHYILVQITNVIDFDLIMMCPLVVVRVWFWHRLQERVDAQLPGDRHSCGKSGN